MVPVEMTEDAAHMRHVCLRRGPLMLAQDARLGGKTPVKGFAETDGFLPYETTDTAGLPFQAICAVTVTPDGKTPMTLVDCASAGSTWDADSDFTVWIEDGEGTNHE